MYTRTGEIKRIKDVVSEDQEHYVEIGPEELVPLLNTPEVDRPAKLMQLRREVAPLSSQAAKAKRRKREKAARRSRAQNRK